MAYILRVWSALADPAQWITRPTGATTGTVIWAIFPVFSSSSSDCTLWHQKKLVALMGNIWLRPAIHKDATSSGFSGKYHYYRYITWLTRQIHCASLCPATYEWNNVSVSLTCMIILNARIHLIANFLGWQSMSRILSRRAPIRVHWLRRVRRHLASGVLLLVCHSHRPLSIGSWFNDYIN